MAAFTPPPLPSEDKRWKIVSGTMRKNGFARHALIETLHTVQSSFGYLDDDAIRFMGVRSWVGGRLLTDRVIASAPECSPAGPILEHAPSVTKETIPSSPVTARA